MTKQIIYGQPPSKSNSYLIINKGRRKGLAKSKSLTEYEESFCMQCALRGQKIRQKFAIEVDIFYKSMQPDLDNSLKIILDCLQKCEAIINDRQCVEIKARKFVDKAKPRVELLLIPKFEK